jgi:hypothetical protein
MMSVEKESLSDSESDSSIGFIDEFDEEEHGLPKLVAVEDTTKKVDDVFTPNQLRYLNSLKVEYLELKKDKKAEFALKVAGRLIKQMEKHGLAKEEKAKGQVRTIGYTTS